MDNKCVVILMATYNGGSYLSQQLDSILAQTHKNWKLLVRDDCSTDNTIKILKKYQEQDKRITILDNKGINLKTIGNFFELIQCAPDSDYYALCDQDDYWYPDKLKRAILCLENKFNDNSIPLLYCSAKEIADEHLNVREISVISKPKLTWQSALVENICTGCTCVFNSALRQKAVLYTPKKCIMHDWWLYLLAVGMGKAYYDKQSYIKYRQHNNNVCGDIDSGWKLFRYRVCQFFSKRGQTYEQTEEFLGIFGVQLGKKERKIAKLLILSRHNIKARIYLVHKQLVYRQTKKDNRVVKFLVLTGKL